jgi:hypothetical protein
MVAWGGDCDPHALTWQDCQDLVIALSDLAPTSLRRYYDTFKILLDFLEITPNPARHKNVVLPKLVKEEVTYPTGEQLLALVDALSPRR